LNLPLLVEQSLDHVPTSRLSSALKSATLTLCSLLATKRCPPVIGRISRKAMTSGLDKTMKELGVVLSGFELISDGMHEESDVSKGDHRGAAEDDG